MDKNGKIFGKISIVDLVVLLLVLVVAFGAVYRFASPSAAVDATVDVVDFTIRIDGVRDFTTVNYHEGLRVYDRQANQFIGHISGIRVEPQYQPIPLLDGSVVRASRPGHVTLYVDVVADGRHAPEAIFIEGTYEINAGSVIYINTKYVQVVGTVYSVNVRYGGS